MPALLFSNGVLRFCCVSPGIMSQTYDWGKYTMVILLVDSDQKALDREAKRLAEHQGAVTAYLHSSASEAIDFVQSNDVDVVYTRQMLSDMSGEELIGRIKQFRPGVEGHILSRGEPVPIPVCGCVDEEFAAREGNAQAQHKEHEDSIGQALENTFFGKRGRLETKQKGDGKMTERELRGLGRRELLELMIEQGRQMEAYQEKYESDLDFMKSEHDKDIEQLKEDYEKDIRDLSASKDSLSRELDALRRERDSLKREADSLRRELDTAREELKSRKITLAQIDEGVGLFIMGLASKILLADTIGALWTEVQTLGFSQVSTPLAWMGIIAYSFQIYFDFSGYSLMAIGLGRMLGFFFPQNFNYPYISKSITEFWRRWHITLSSWFRDYVYIPLGGNRVKKSRQFFNIFVVWFLTGFWHGAAWNFIFWGLYFFVLLMIEKSFLLKHLEKSKVLSHVYLIFFIIISWGIFALSDLSQMGALFSRMFSLHGGTDWMYYLRDYAAMFVLCILASTPFFKKLADSAAGKNRVVRTVFLAGVLVVCVAFMVDSTYSPFLYFNF